MPRTDRIRRIATWLALAGSIGLFVILALVMFITRRTNWYDIQLGMTATDHTR